MPLSINPYLRAGASQVLTNPVANTVAGNLGVLPGILSPEKQKLDSTVNRLSGGIGSGLNGNTAGSRNTGAQVNLSQVATSITALGGQSGLISQQRANQIGAAVGLANVIGSGNSVSVTQAAGALGIPGPGIPIPPIVGTVLGNLGQPGTVTPGPAAAQNKITQAIASGGTAVGSPPLNVSANSAANLASNLIQAARSANVQGTVGPLFDTIEATVREIPVDPGDWRVRINAPDAIGGGEIVFPVLPNISLAHKANYTDTGLVHTNYLFLAYKNSQVEDIQISCEWPVETFDDCRGYLEMVRLGRTLTKMFYGRSENLGNPPPICTLKGYGGGEDGRGGVILPDTPVVVKNFSMDLKDDVNYIEYQKNWVPRLSSISITVGVVYNRNTQRNFNLLEYRDGKNPIRF